MAKIDGTIVAMVRTQFVTEVRVTRSQRLVQDEKRVPVQGKSISTTCHQSFDAAVAELRGQFQKWPEGAIRLEIFGTVSENNISGAIVRQDTFTVYDVELGLQHLAEKKGAELYRLLKDLSDFKRDVAAERIANAEGLVFADGSVKDSKDGSRAPVDIGDVFAGPRGEFLPELISYAKASYFFADVRGDGDLNGLRDLSDWLDDYDGCSWKVLDDGYVAYRVANGVFRKILPAVLRKSDLNTFGDDGEDELAWMIEESSGITDEHSCNAFIEQAYVFRTKCLNMRTAYDSMDYPASRAVLERVISALDRISDFYGYMVSSRFQLAAITLGSVLTTLLDAWMRVDGDQEDFQKQVMDVIDRFLIRKSQASH